MRSVVWIASFSEGRGEVILQKLPIVVFVTFSNCSWEFYGLQEKGLCPITIANTLDKGRRNHRLKIRRSQLTLAPAFAMTAHALQGQTLFAAILDLFIGSGTSPLTSYVALFRVCSREDVLIYLRVLQVVFNQRVALGPGLFYAPFARLIYP